MRPTNKKSNDKPIPGYRSLFDAEEALFIEDFKDRPNKWISMELERMNKAFVDNAPDSRSLINRAQLGALFTIARDRKMLYLEYKDDGLPNSEWSGGDVIEPERSNLSSPP